MEQINLSQFKDREVLDSYVLSEIGDNLTLNRSAYIINGTKEQLDNFHLDEIATIYGIKVKII